MDDDEMFAKDTPVVITRREGNRVYVGDLIAVDDDFVRGEPRERALTAEGWIVPQGPTVEEAHGLSAGNNEAIEGYYMPLIDPQAEELQASEMLALVLKAEKQAVSRMALNGSEQPPIYYGREH